MSNDVPASEATKNTLENNVNWFLADKLQDPATTIARKKYLTTDNLLVYLTKCNVSEVSVPRIKVQVLRRVQGGVQEVGYQIFSDHRFEKYHNDMIFGAAPSGADGSGGESITETEAQELLGIVNGLANARQTI